MVITRNVKALVGAGIVVGALGAATIGGAFAAPVHDTTTPAATPTVTTSGQPSGQSTTTGQAQQNPAPSGQQQPNGGPGQNGIGPFAGRGPGHGPGGPGGPGGFRGFGGPDLDAVATLLGMQPADLRTQLGQGQTLTQIATAHGKTAADVKQALLNALKTRLDQAVSSGRITATQETDQLNAAGTRIDQLLTANLANQPNGGPNGGPGPRGVRGLGGNAMQTIAQTLGITTQQLQTELSGGKTLAQVVQAHGKSLADVKTAVLNALKDELAQRDQQILNNASTQFDQFANGQTPSRPAPATAPAPAQTPTPST